MRWVMHENFFKYLKSVKIIPLNTHIPSARINDERSEAEGSKQYVLGEISPTPIAEITKPEPKEFNKSFLVDISYAELSDKYLSEIEEDIRTKSQAVELAGRSYWKKLQRSHDIGKELTNRISREEIENTLTKGRFYYRNEHDELVHLASPDSPNGLEWFVSVANYYYTNTNLLDDFQQKKLKKIPFFLGVMNTINLKPEVRAMITGALEECKFIDLTAMKALARLMGLCTSLDCVVAHAILINEHPKFTSESLNDAKLIDTNGKKILFSMFDEKVIMFGVEKRRASARKVEMFTDLSKMVFETIVSGTEKIRAKLKSKGHHQYRNLFLNVSQFSTGVPHPYEQLSLKDKSFYATEIEIFTRAGIGKNTLTLKRIRNNKGLLYFFERGSAKDVSRILGNEEMTAKRNYIPEWLIRKWNERIVRIFQSTLIVISAHDKPWLVSASDFKTTEELHSFISKRILTNGNKDPIANLLSLRWSDRVNIKTTQRPSAFLNLHLSPDSLAMIEAYVEFCRDNMSDLERQSLGAGSLTPSDITELFNLICAAVSLEEGTDAEEAIQSQIRGDSLKSLRKAFTEAKSLVNGIKEQFTNFELQH